MARLGIICGMEPEAKALGAWREDLGVSVRISGARPERAEALARDLVSQGVRGLLSWGIAGGLAPRLKTGGLVRPSDVLATGGTRYPITLGAGPDGLLVGMDHMIRTPAEKKGLRAATGAQAVDMESHRVAKVASEAGLPFGVIRVVSDSLEQTLPSLAETALGADGRPRIGAVIRGLLGRPFELPLLLQAGRDSKRALSVLAAQADQVIPGILSEIE